MHKLTLAYGSSLRWHIWATHILKLARGPAGSMSRNWVTEATIGFS